MADTERVGQRMRSYAQPFLPLRSLILETAPDQWLSSVGINDTREIRWGG